MNNFESRVEFTEDLQKMSDVSTVVSPLIFLEKISYWKKSSSQGTNQMLSDIFLRLREYI